MGGEQQPGRLKQVAEFERLLSQCVLRHVLVFVDVEGSTQHLAASDALGQCHGADHSSA